MPESLCPTWDYLLLCQRQDMNFIDFAINETRRRATVDDRRIAVMGMSDGASLALSMALRNPLVFRTALVQAAGFYHSPTSVALKPKVGASKELESKGEERRTKGKSYEIMRKSMKIY